MGGSRLDGRVAAVSGGTRGIGRAIAEAFLDEGASVVINGRSPEKGAAALAEMNGGDRVSFWPGSVADQVVAEGLVDHAVETYGQIDILVCNAGGVRDTAPVVDMSDEEWQYELNLNLNHTFWTTRRALRYMVPQRSGRVLAISSVEGKVAKPNIAGYAANKHGINGFVKSVAREVGVEGITVNAICPGIVVTDMVHERAGRAQGLGGVDELVSFYTAHTALQRPVTVGEIAAFAVHLASDEGAGFSGGTISLDGGDAYY
ncbi:MAG: 3-oxoacyl-ACP reductase [Acidimicrobiaceae bacterium]|nr:3-oxoacyl-ACP reductase [Acidimicrobiaceae bacterium]|tara:strand:+ start:11328 stop:12107 length:780 start_codon:yes stop_codon:yes gene_type:complete